MSCHENNIDVFVSRHDRVLELNHKVDRLVDLAIGKSVQADFHREKELLVFEKIATEDSLEGEGLCDWHD